MKRLSRKWINTIIISISLVVMTGIVLAFYFIILYTPNLNSFINISATNVLGSVSINIKNAENGNPYSYFTFENTTTNEKTHSFTNKNLLFKSDNSSITIELEINNMSFYDAVASLEIKGPGKNGKLVFCVNNVEQELTNTFVFKPNEVKVVSFVISKQNFSKPLRGNFTVNLNITKYVEQTDDELENTQTDDEKTNEQTQPAVQSQILSLI